MGAVAISTGPIAHGQLLDGQGMSIPSARVPSFSQEAKSMTASARGSMKRQRDRLRELLPPHRGLARRFFVLVRHSVAI